MSPLRILFISWSTVGGSGQSQRQLATRLAARGHDVRFVVHDPRAARATRLAYERLSDLSVRLGGRMPGATVARMRSLPGRRSRRRDLEGLPHLWSPVPQNALRPAITAFRPHMVVANSVDRWAWRRINSLCRENGIATALYIREEASLEHLRTGSLPSLLLANTPSLAERLADEGHECAFVPSVVDLGATETESTRARVLAINPIPMKGSDIVWELARRLPRVPFVVQEAWPLSDRDLEAVRAKAASHPNVEFRRAAPPGPSLYGDARILLAPYLVDSRPRVVLEAQANGIPVLASDLPSLVDAVGKGGLTLPVERIEPWVSAIEALYADEGHYTELSDAARAHASRPEVDPDVVSLEFERLVRRVLAREGDQRVDHE